MSTSFCSQSCQSTCDFTWEFVLVLDFFCEEACLTSSSSWNPSHTPVLPRPLDACNPESVVLGAPRLSAIAIPCLGVHHLLLIAPTPRDPLSLPLPSSPFRLSPFPTPTTLFPPLPPSPSPRRLPLAPSKLSTHSPPFPADGVTQRTPLVSR